MEGRQTSEKMGADLRQDEENRKGQNAGQLTNGKPQNHAYGCMDGLETSRDPSAGAVPGEQHVSRDFKSDQASMRCQSLSTSETSTVLIKGARI